MANCLNCGTQNVENSNFCSECGQKTTIRSLTFWNLIGEFISNFFNLETKIWRTLRDIWIPGKLTKAFVQGKRVTYSHPIRIFIVVLVSFFTLFLFNVNETLKEMNDIPLEIQKKLWTNDKVVEFDSIASRSTIGEEDLIYIRKNLFHEEESLGAIDTLVQEALNEEGILKYYELENNSKLNIFQKFELIDSLMQDSLFNPNIDTTDIGGTKFSFESDDFTDGVFIESLYKLSPDELKAEYAKGTRWKEIGVVQIQKIVKNPNSSVKFLIGNGTWAIVAVILLLGLVFKLIYVRKRRLYAEHIIFHLYGHSRILLMAIIGLLSSLIFKIDFMWMLMILVVGPIYLFLGIKSYYGQSYFKTIIKFLFTLLMYLFLIIFCSFVIVGISFLVF